MSSIIAEQDPAAMIYNSEDKEMYELKESYNVIVNTNVDVL